MACRYHLSDLNFGESAPALTGDLSALLKELTNEVQHRQAVQATYNLVLNRNLSVSRHVSWSYLRYLFNELGAEKGSQVILKNLSSDNAISYNMCDTMSWSFYLAGPKIIPVAQQQCLSGSNANIKILALASLKKFLSQEQFVPYLLLSLQQGRLTERFLGMFSELVTDIDDTQLAEQILTAVEQCPLEDEAKKRVLEGLFKTFSGLSINYRFYQAYSHIRLPYANPYLRFALVPEVQAELIQNVEKKVLVGESLAILIHHDWVQTDSPIMTADNLEETFHNLNMSELETEAILSFFRKKTNQELRQKVEETLFASLLGKNSGRNPYYTDNNLTTKFLLETPECAKTLQNIQNFQALIKDTTSYSSYAPSLNYVETELLKRMGQTTLAEEKLQVYWQESSFSLSNQNSTPVRLFNADLTPILAQNQAFRKLIKENLTVDQIKRHPRSDHFLAMALLSDDQELFELVFQIPADENFALNTTIHLDLLLKKPVFFEALRQKVETEMASTAKRTYFTDRFISELSHLKQEDIPLFLRLQVSQLLAQVTPKIVSKDDFNTDLFGEFGDKECLAAINKIKKNLMPRYYYQGEHRIPQLPNDLELAMTKMIRQQRIKKEPQSLN